jgi:GAF domain-containing protein
LGIESAGPGRALTEIAETLSSHSSLADLLEQLVVKVRDLFGVRRSSIFLHESQSGLFHGYVANDPTIPDAKEVVKRLVCGMPADGFSLECVATRKPVLIANARLDHRPLRAAVQNRNLIEVLGIPLVAQGEVVGLIFLDDPGARHGFDSSDLALASTLGGLVGMALRQVRSSEALRDSAAKIARHNKLLQRSRQLQEQLTRLALESSSIQDIADAVVKVLGEPCLIFDADMRRLGSAATDAVGDPIRSLLDAGAGDPAEVAKVLREVGENGPSIVGPLRAGRTHRREIIAPIYARDRGWGYLVVSEVGRRLTSLDLGVAKQAADIVALEFSASRREAFLDTEARDALIKGLLDGTAGEPGLRERVTRHGLKPEERYAVVIFQAPPESNADLTCPVVDAALNGAGLTGIPAATEVEGGDIVALVPLSDEFPQAGMMGRVKERIEAAAALLSPSGEVIAAISSPATMPEECPLAFAEARNVLACRRPSGLEQGSVIAADELGAGRLILACGGEAEALRFAGQVLGPLLDPDSARGGELLATLASFVSCGLSVREAALDLDVHENTIRYRLSRVAKLTGLDPMMDAEAQLSLQLAVIILRLHGRLAPAPPAAAATADPVPA